MAEARRAETFSHFGPDQVLARAKELGFPEAGGSDGDDPAYRTAVFDAVVQERDLLRMLDVLDREREACRFEGDDNSDDDSDDEPCFGALSMQHKIDEPSCFDTTVETSSGS